MTDWSEVDKSLKGLHLLGHMVLTTKVLYGFFQHPPTARHSSPVLGMCRSWWGKMSLSSAKHKTQVILLKHVALKYLGNSREVTVGYSIILLATHVYNVLHVCHSEHFALQRRGNVK